MTLVWGSTFVVVKVAVESVDPLAFVAARFGVGALALGLVYWRRLLKATSSLWLAGGLLGAALFVALTAQTYGLRETTPARAGFITGLSVLLVPLLAAGLTRRSPGRAPLAGVALALVGMALLAAPLTTEEWSSGSWRGDALVLVCSIAVALHIVGVGHFAGRHDAAAITVAQLAAVALLAASLGVLSGTRAPLDAASWPAIAYMGLIATAVVFLVQNWAQIHTPPTHAALIFALEPVFAALFSWLSYGEAITVRVVAGGLLIVGGIVVAEIGGGRD